MPRRPGGVGWGQQSFPEPAGNSRRLFSAGMWTRSIGQFQKPISYFEGRNMPDRQARKFGNSIVVTLVALFCMATLASAQTKLLRFPDIHGDQVVFSYGSDL